MGNIFKPDKRIHLDEKNHKYILNDNKDIVFTSVTECISQYFEKFDKIKIAQKLVSSHPKYIGMTMEELIAKWDESATNGTIVHKEIEDYINEKRQPNHQKSKIAIEWLSKHLMNSKYQLFSEIIVYCEDLHLAGTIDLLLYDSVNEIYTILDWKTNKEISTKSFKGKTGIKPETRDLPDCKFTHYSLQLSLYRYLLEKKYNLKMKKLIIAHITEQGVKGYVAPYLKNHIFLITQKILGN
tara:strand:+ start:1460 stop:2179 length:720 start_codon:yes stop_codon:yes gene_type:complete